MTGLVELNMSNNLITEIPSDIGHAISLTDLNLGGNAITRLPIEIGLLTNLTYLEVDPAQLTLPPKEIVQSGTTQVVNYLRQICQSKESGNLILDTQGLWSLPDEVTALPNLVTLSMRENQLVVLPSTISKLTTLTELMLSNNQLGSFLTRCPRR
jgi:Leucine-rich repeat (LRR) protein